jgi:hypothetical protein
MKKALSLLLFTLISIGMSMPLYAGELRMLNEFAVTGFFGDRGDATGHGDQLSFSSILGSRGSYSSEPGFSINWWVEANDKTWGYQDMSEDQELNLKVMYGKYETERFTLSAGYLDVLMGNGHNFQADGFGGFLVDLMPSKTTTITLLASLTNENDADGYVDGDGPLNTDGAWLSDEDGEEDTWMYGIQVAQKFKGGNASIYYLTSQDASIDTDSNTFGLAGNLNVNGIALSAETATFFGDAGDGADYDGLIATIGASMQATETLTVETNLYYAQGNDDSDSTQFAFLKRGMQQPMQKGLDQLDHEDGTLQLISKDENFFSIGGCGVIGANLSGSLKISEKASVSAGIVYGAPEDNDNATNSWDSLTKLNVGYSNSISKSLTFAIAASYLTFDNSDDYDEDMYGTTAVLRWAF